MSWRPYPAATAACHWPDSAANSGGASPRAASITRSTSFSAHSSALPGRVGYGGPRRAGTGKVNAGYERRLGADQVAQLVRDRAEHLGRPGAAGD